MKNLKKLLAVALSLAILLTLTVPVMAAEMTAAQKVELLGVLLGEGNGVDSAYLSKATTRVQGAVLLLRLLDKEDEAKAYAGTDNFVDVVGNEWYAPIAAYLKANPSLGFVGYNNKFEATRLMTGNELYKVLLTVLGYKQGVDFEWSEVADFAASKGLVALENPNDPIANVDVADAILEALQAEMTDGVVLIDYLIAEGIVSAADANAAGLISTLAIISAVPTNADEITVTFNKPVEGTPVITIKNGPMNIFVNKTWNAAKTQVVLKRSNSIVFTAGTYEVAVGDLKASVKFEKEVASQVVINKATLLISAKPEFEVYVNNQYGKKMLAGGQIFSATAFNSTTGAVLVVEKVSGSDSKFTVNTAGVKENEIITVTAMHHQTTIVGQANITAVAASKVSEFALNNVVLPTGASRVNPAPTHTSVVIDYVAKDQYGVAMTLKSLTDVTSGSGLTFVSSDNSILKVEDMRFDSNGKLTFKPLKAGTVTLSVLVNSTSLVTSLTIQVFDPAAVSKVIIAGAEKDVIEDETTEISFIALDQFQNELEKKTANILLDQANGLSFSAIMSDPSKVSFTYADGILKVAPLAGSKGMVTVYYYWKNVLQGQFSLNIYAKAVPTSIDSVAIKNGIELGATQNLAASSIKVLDQYGRDYSKITASNRVTMDNSQFQWKSNPATGGMISDATANGTAGWDFTASATTEGAVTYTVQLVGKADSLYSFSMKAVNVNKAENGVTYNFDTIPTLYSNAAFTAKAVADQYAKEVKLIGKTSDGTVVSLQSGKIYQLTSSNVNVKVEKVGASWFVYSGHKDAQTSTLRAYDSTGKLLCNADVSATVARTAKAVVFGADQAFSGSIDLAVKYADLKFKINDEYGVNMLTTTTPAAFDLTANGFFATSDSSILTVNGSTITAVGTGKVTLTYITNTGLSDSIVLTVSMPN